MDKLNDKNHRRRVAVIQSLLVCTLVSLASCHQPPNEQFVVAPPEFGRFERVGSYLTGAHPVTAVVADVDGDGDDDVIAPALVTNDVIALRNDDGVLAWSQLAPLTIRASFVLAADVIDGGLPELIISSRDENAVIVYSISIGADGFPTLLPTLELQALTPDAMAAGDFDLDGDIDFAVSQFRDSSIAVFHQTANGLELARTIESSPGPMALASADLDGDGRVELVSAAAASDLIDVYKQVEGEWNRVISIPTAAWPASIEVGKPSNGAVQLFGAATIGDQVFQIDLQTTSEPWTATIKTIATGDGSFEVALIPQSRGRDLEFVVTHKDESTASLHVVQGGGVVEIERFSTGNGAGPSPVFPWDYDDDGVTDLALVNAFADEVVIYRGWEPDA